MTPGNHSDESVIHPTRLRIDREAWVASNATLTGWVSLGAKASVWYGCVLRGDLDTITIGDETNVQDLTVVHVDAGAPVLVGRRVTIGHRAVIHGCTIDDEAVVGMGAVLLSGSRVGPGALVAAGAVLREGFEVPPGAIAAGVPARIRGEVSQDLCLRFREGVESYLRLAAHHRSRA